MTNKPNFYYASDYAGLGFKGGGFYYGYEHVICLKCGKTIKGSEFCDECEDSETDWCFVAHIGKEEIVIPFSKLGCKDMFDVVDCLMTGVGWVLAKYELVDSAIIDRYSTFVNPSEKSDLEDGGIPAPN